MILLVSKPEIPSWKNVYEFPYEQGFPIVFAYEFVSILWVDASKEQLGPATPNV